MPRLRNLLRRNSHVDNNEGADSAESPQTRRPTPREYPGNDEEGEETELVLSKRPKKRTSVPRTSGLHDQRRLVQGNDNDDQMRTRFMESLSLSPRPSHAIDGDFEQQLQQALEASRAEGRRPRPDRHALQEADELRKAILQSKKAAKAQERQRQQALQEQEENMEEELRRVMEESRRMAAEEERRRAHGMYTFQPSWSEGHQVSHQNNTILPPVSPRPARLPERVPRRQPRHTLDNGPEDEVVPSRRALVSTRASRTRPQKISDNDSDDEVPIGLSRRVPASKRTSGTWKRETSDNDSEDGVAKGPLRRVPTCKRTSGTRKQGTSDNELEDKAPKGPPRRVPASERTSRMRKSETLKKALEDEVPKGPSRRARAPKRASRRRARKSSDDSSDEEGAASSTTKQISQRRRQNGQEDDSSEGSTTPTPRRQAPSPKRTSRRPQRSTSDDELEVKGDRPTPSRRASTRKQIPRRTQQDNADDIPKDGETPVAVPRRPSRRQPRASLDNIAEEEEEEEEEEEAQTPSLAPRRPPRRKPQNTLDAIPEDAERSPTTTPVQRARTTQDHDSGSTSEGSGYQNIITRTSFGSQNTSRAPQSSPSTEVVKHKEPPISMTKLKTLCEMAFPVDHQIERAIQNSRTTRGIEIVQRSEDALYNEQMAAALANSMADPNLEDAPDITETGLDEHPPFYHALKGKKISDPSKWTTSDYREGKPGYKKKIDKRVLEVMRAWRDLGAFYESEQYIDLTKTNQAKAKAITYTLDEPPVQAEDTPTEVAESVGEFARLPARQMPTEPNETANWVNRTTSSAPGHGGAHATYK
ncbi:MAG: hypothetical protein LQ351_005308 [Letrouitia transgressa]|nr:MAG: hypothetical protein LQ351_005308 [Letrouitia transgressa]